MRIFALELNNVLKGNFLFRQFVLKPDVKAGIRRYNESKRSK